MHRKTFRKEQGLPPIHLVLLFEIHPFSHIMHRMNNLRGIDLNLLVVLDALLVERHVSRTALRLNMSQPAVSHALARLRSLLDDPLLTRQGGGLAPTIRAMELSKPLAEALAQIRSVLGPDSFEPGRTKHTFRLAMSDYGAEIVLPNLLRTLRRSAPSIDLAVTQLSREGMIAGIMDGDIDLGLGVFPLLPEQILPELLLNDDYACLIDRATLPLSAQLIDLDTYLARPHALVAVHGEASTEIDEAIHAAGYARRVALIIPHWSVAPKTIAGTDLILTVARTSLKFSLEDKRLAVLPPPIPLPAIPFSQISHKRRRSDPALRWLREMIVASTA
ncbi:LysR substrate-binding domain-containing protein [Telmatospirillum sp.]|uniref:LysR substrate-binding domain-containing protein n=1 Tax=Telmatospirillum sp. TaxID=2079197 RepID=UPI0028527EAA|nr:LysR substrate-binding domain-containing protein [Telmatospirillum sp.]